jgi:hypothetical protein
VTKYLRKYSYKEERFIMDHGFRDFSPCSFGPVTFGPMAPQYILAEACGREAAHLMVTRKQRAERERKE